MFGRKAREELHETLKALTIERLERQMEKLQHEKEIKQLVDDHIAAERELRERIHELEIAEAVLKERLDLMTQMPQFAASAEPRDLSLSEEREDLEHALRAGLIGSEQFQAELEASGLLNTQIDFAAEDYPRLGARA